MSPFRQPRWWALLVIGLWLAHGVATVSLFHAWIMAPIVGVWLGLAWRFDWGAHSSRKPAHVWPWSLLPLPFWGLYLYLVDSFGELDLGAVFFHLQAGIQGHGGIGRLLAAGLYTLAMVALLAAFTWLVRTDPRWRRAERLLAVVLIASNPLIYGLGQRSAAIVSDDGAWLERRYVPPVLHESPDTPPNLLLLYLESLERTYGDEARFGSVYDDLEALGRRGLVFEGVRQIDNTGWTMAGMIASQCGTPLMPAGLLHDSQFDPLDKVVPGIDCLGDLLDARGYRLAFLGGASTRFAGKGVFYDDHGFDQVLGREELAPNLTDPDYLNSWGLYDDSLYDFTVEEIRRLDRGDAPWAVVNLSLATHAPTGYPPRRCEEHRDEEETSDILHAVACSARLVRDLVQRLEAEGLLDNTLVAIASDHLSMRVPVWEKLVSGPRANTFLLLGEPMTRGRIEREASTLDIFPTLLEAMGFTLDDHRAGLGVSLLSSEPTLVEEYGIAALNARMRAETALQQRLWEGLAPQRPESTVPQEQVMETPDDAADEQPTPRTQ